MQRFTLGRASVGLETAVSRLRFFTDAKDDEVRPKYLGSALIEFVCKGEAVVSNMTAERITRQHLEALVLVLWDRGVKWLYVERLPGHVLPMGVKRNERPFLGYYEVDLARIVLERCTRLSQTKPDEEK